MKPVSGTLFGDLFGAAWHHAGTQRRRMVLFYGLSLVANVMIAFDPVVMARILNAVQANGPDVLQQALFWAFLFGVLTIGFWLLHGPARVLERELSFEIYRAYVNSLYRAVTEMPLKWHQDHHSGDTINRINKAGQSLYGFSGEQYVLISMVVRFTMSLIVLGTYSPWVLVIALFTSLLITLLIRRFDRSIIPLIEATNERSHRLNAVLFDYISNIITVLTLRLQDATRCEVDLHTLAMKPPLWREIRLNEWKWGLINILLVCTQALIIGGYIGFHLLRHEPVIIGSVVAIFQYLLMISSVFFSAAHTYGQLIQRHTDIKGVEPLLEDHARLSKSLRPEAAAQFQRIAIHNLSFTHREGEDALHHLRDIDITIEKGQKIALIGSSGSGKTTLLTLLRGLFDAGNVRLSIDAFSFESLAPLSGFTTLVPQDSEIFENTVRYNLTLGTEVEDGIVEEALRITTFGDVVPTLPEGLETDIRERGVNLSGGQKQRLSLARGLIAARFSQLLLLDEPTSSVDLPTEGFIFDRLFQAFSDRAIVASIHRLHLLPRFDRIVLMQNGVIMEQGSFSELLARGGLFQSLWHHHLRQSATGPEN